MRTDVVLGVSEVFPRLREGVQCGKPWSVGTGGSLSLGQFSLVCVLQKKGPILLL